MEIDIRHPVVVACPLAAITCALILIGYGPTALADDAIPASGRTDLCGLLTKAEVSRALKVTIVRAEALDTDQVGCEFSAKGTLADAGAGHATELANSAAAAHGTTLDASTQNLINAFGKGIFQGSDADKSATSAARHPGEVPVLTVAIQPGDAEDQMRRTRRTPMPACRRKGSRPSWGLAMKPSTAVAP